ncbi:MAG: hypothetical protein IKS90_02055 [Clostridia bacterium]|nr:hypothetical protein [Clostridia bacterium]
MREWQSKLVERGVCDERGVAFSALAKTLPNGESELVFLALNGSELHIYECDLNTSAGRQLYAVDLKRVRDLKVGNTFMQSRLSFTFDGNLFAFRGIVAGLIVKEGKAALAEIKKECVR